MHGYREIMRAVKDLDAGLARTVRNRLKKAAEPVAEETRQEVSVYPGASVSTIGPRISARGVFVTQRKRKVTGEHPEFGNLQMGIMIKALEDNQDKILREIDDAIDDLARHEGFSQGGFI